MSRRNPKHIKWRKWRAGYTVEAAFIVPLVLFAMAFAMKLGISMYQEVAAETEQESIADMWEVGEFYNWQTVREVLNDKS